MYSCSQMFKLLNHIDMNFLTDKVNKFVCHITAVQTYVLGKIFVN